MVPNLFIGMPVYNGEKFVAEALDSIMAQTYTDWKLVISDNASTDDTQRICQHYASKDARIHYVRQETNIGAMPNFRFLLEQADTPYFMWAAADDMWKESFVEACVTGLESDDEVGWAFTNMVNIDSFGRTIRNYPSFARFLYTDRAASVARFALDPEYLGKANLIYGVYKLETLKEFLLAFLKIIAESPSFLSADLALNLGVMCRTSLYIDERVLFCKRYVRPTDRRRHVDWIEPLTPHVRGLLSMKDFALYKEAASRASEGTPYVELVMAINQYRELLVSDGETIRMGDESSLATIVKNRVNGQVLRGWQKVKRLSSST